MGHETEAAIGHSLYGGQVAPKWGAKNYDNERDVDADHNQCVHGCLLPNIRCRTLVEPPSVNLDPDVFRLAQSDNDRQASIR